MKIVKIILIILGILILLAFVIGPLAQKKLDSLEQQQNAQKTTVEWELLRKIALSHKTGFKKIEEVSSVFLI